MIGVAEINHYLAMIALWPVLDEFERWIVAGGDRTFDEWRVA
jgi:hypothetical protein